MIIQNNRKTITNLEGKITLKPGNNTVETALWAELRKNPIVKKKMEADELVEMSDFDEEMAKVANGEEGAPSSSAEHDENFLLEQKVPAARMIVEQTTDLELLEKWLAKENRNQVKSVLNKQIAVLKEPNEKRDRNQKRQVSGSGMQPEVIELTEEQTRVQPGDE